MKKATDDSTEITHTVLLVDDNLDDVELTRQTFARTPRNVALHQVGDGEKCLDFLRKKGEYSEAPTPELVLLDLNMPVMDGRDVLIEVSKDLDLKQLPIVVLTTSNAKTDLMVSYQLGCRSYVVKPVDMNRFQHLIDDLCEYWFDTVALPPIIS